MESCRDPPQVCQGQREAAVPGKKKKKLTFVKCLSLTLLQALNCREHILRLTCQPMTTKLLTLPSPVPHIPVRHAATLTEECFLEMYSQHQGR